MLRSTPSLAAANGTPGVRLDKKPLLTCWAAAFAFRAASCDPSSMTAQEEKPKKKRPRDLNRLAASIVEDATSDQPTEDAPSDSGKNPHAQALGRLGGQKGGKARAKKLTPEQRKEIAQKAAQARWRNKST